ncbi:transposase [Maricaulis salignorans]|uniref:Putative transposase n=1 Tax=Maricaulis salignorans TaxID=144026 RepID=A0A1G9SH97_9PROT|nr:transposase [Maricaulis salignorans]SDM34175.1 putative transposase [Maricaulis salignorans]
MPRKARHVLPHYPHHVTQRGNRRQPTFFQDSDYRLYLELMQQACSARGVLCWAYCLMPNHVHLVLEPPEEGALAATVGWAHQAYCRAINRREGWTGSLWQGRFSSCAMDETHALVAVRYVELNPVRAGLRRRAQEWQWSSAASRVFGLENRLLCRPPILRGIRDWQAYLDTGLTAAQEAQLGYFTQSGQPMMDAASPGHAPASPVRVPTR